jgi:hypothetical protein
VTVSCLSTGGLPISPNTLNKIGHNRDYVSDLGGFVSLDKATNFELGQQLERRKILELLEKEHTRLSYKDYNNEPDKLLVLLGFRLAIDTVKFGGQSGEIE